MITINNSIELLTASINEAYKENGEVWEKVLVLRFPKSEFSFEEANRLAEEAETVTNVTKEKVFEYSVTDVLDKKENPYFSEIWVNNPSVEVTDNLAEKLNEAEGKLSEAETMLDIITEGGVADEGEN